MLFVVKIGQRKGSVLEFRQQLFILHYSILKLCSCLTPERAPCTRSSPSRRSIDRPQKIVAAARERAAQTRIPPAESSRPPAESPARETESRRRLPRSRESAAPRRAIRDDHRHESPGTRSTP